MELRPRAACGRKSKAAISAAVEKPEDQREPERFFGHRKAEERKGRSWSIVFCASPSARSRLRFSAAAELVDTAEYSPEAAIAPRKSPGEFQKGARRPLLVVSIREVLRRGRNRNLPLLSVVFFGTFLLDKQKKATPRPWGGILRVAQDDRSGSHIIPAPPSAFPALLRTSRCARRRSGGG